MNPVFVFFAQYFALDIARPGIRFLLWSQRHHACQQTSDGPPTMVAAFTTELESEQDLANAVRAVAIFKNDLARVSGDALPIFAARALPTLSK
ncbi:MAG TPA: hypothetical protein VIX14_07345 [Terriglobales bacterium]